MNLALAILALANLASADLALAIFAGRVSERIALGNSVHEAGRDSGGMGGGHVMMPVH